MELQVIVGLSLYSKGQFDRAVATLEPLAGAWRDKSLYWKKCLRGFNKSNRRCTVLLMLRCKFCNPLFVHIPILSQHSFYDVVCGHSWGRHRKQSFERESCGCCVS